MGPVEGLGGQMPILIKPFLFLVAFAPIAVLFASVFGLACLLLMTCVRAIAWLPTVGQRLGNSANVPRPYLRGLPIINKSLQHQR
jgi:hypothetical protein